MSEIIVGAFSVTVLTFFVYTIVGHIRHSWETTKFTAIYEALFFTLFLAPFVGLAVLVESVWGLFPVAVVISTGLIWENVVKRIIWRTTPMVGRLLTNPEERPRGR